VNTQELKDSVADLSALIEGLPKSDQSFANSLVDRFKTTGGKLSDKQQYWVGEMLTRAVTGDSGRKASATIKNVANIFALFNAAQESKLKYPKITFDVNDTIVQISIAGPKSKVPGSLNLTDGKPFGCNIWYGRLLTDGDLMLSKALVEEDIKVVTRLLCRLAVNPEGTIYNYGQKSGHCCLCNAKMTTEKSLAAGIGPVCAKKWNLGETS